jgi:hypothetical protein
MSHKETVGLAPNKFVLTNVFTTFSIRESIAWTSLAYRVKAIVCTPSKQPTSSTLLLSSPIN